MDELKCIYRLYNSTKTKKHLKSSFFELWYTKFETFNKLFWDSDDVKLSHQDSITELNTSRESYFSVNKELEQREDDSSIIILPDF
jgi:calcineurin-like phosphoesterase family protein